MCTANFARRAFVGISCTMVCAAALSACASRPATKIAAGAAPAASQSGQSVATPSSLPVPSSPTLTSLTSPVSYSHDLLLTPPPDGATLALDWSVVAKKFDEPTLDRLATGHVEMATLTVPGTGHIKSDGSTSYDQPASSLVWVLIYHRVPAGLGSMPIMGPPAHSGSASPAPTPANLIDYVEVVDPATVEVEYYLQDDADTQASLAPSVNSGPDPKSVPTG